MRLGEDEVGRHERHPARDGLPDQGVGLGVVLVAGAEQDDPGAVYEAERNAP